MVTIVSKTIAPIAVSVNEISISPDEKYIFPATGSGAPFLLVRNDLTGNYDTTVAITGASAVSMFSTALGNSRAYWGVGSTVYWATRSGSVWTYGGSFAAAGAIRSLSLSQDGAFLGVGSTLTEMFETASHIRRGVFNEGDYLEDMEWTLDNTQLIGATRSAGQFVYTKLATSPVTFSRTAIAGSISQGNWCIAMHPDGDEYVIGNYFTGGGGYVYRRVAGVWTKQPSSIFSDGGFTAASLSVSYFSGGGYILLQDVGGTISRCYRRDGTNYVVETLSGYTTQASYQAKNAPTDKATIVAQVLSVSPWVAVYKGPDTGNVALINLTAPKSDVDGTLKLTNNVNAALVAPKSVIDSDITVPTAGAGIFVAPRPYTAGMIAVAIGAPGEIKSYFDFDPARVAARTERVTVLDQVATRRTLYANLKAPKAKSSGIITQGRVIQGDLRAPKSKMAGYAENPYNLSAELTAPKATFAGDVLVEISGVVAVMRAPKAQVSGELDLLYKVSIGLTAPKARVTGSLGNLYINGALTAPRAKLAGIGGPDYQINGVLIGRRPVIKGLVGSVGAYSGDMVAPKAKLAGSLEYETRILTGSMVAPKALANGELSLPEGIYGALVAPRPFLTSDIEVPWGLRGNLTAPKAKFNGIALRYVRADANLRAPKAKAAGELGFPNGIKIGDMRAPRAVFDGELKTRYLVTGIGTAPKPITDGELRLIARLQGDLTAPKALADGELFFRYLANGDLTAPKGTTVPSRLKVVYRLDGIYSSAPKGVLAGELKTRYLLDGFHSTAPKGVLAGEMKFIRTVRAPLVAPKAVFDGELKTRYKLDGFHGTAPKGIFDGELVTRYNLEGFSTSAPAGRVSGRIAQGWQLDGEFTAPRAVVTGLLSVADGFFGQLTAPRAVVDGELKLFQGVRAALTAPKAVADGELFLRYLVEGIGSAPRGQTDGYIEVKYKLEGIGTAPSASFDGELLNRYRITGIGSAPMPIMVGVLGFKIDATLEAALTAPRPAVAGLLNNIDIRRRRNLTVVRR